MQQLLPQRSLSPFPTVSSLASESEFLCDCAGAAVSEEATALGNRSTGQSNPHPCLRLNNNLPSGWTCSPVDPGVAAPVGSGFCTAASCSTRTTSEREEVTVATSSAMPPQNTESLFKKKTTTGGMVGASPSFPSGGAERRHSPVSPYPPETNVKKRRITSGTFNSNNNSIVRNNNTKCRTSQSESVNAGPIKRQNTEVSSTATSATTLTMSPTGLDFHVEEDWHSHMSGAHHGKTATATTASDEDAVATNSAGPSVTFTLLAGAPPPSGLRDPVTLLQLLPLDLLFQPTQASPHVASVLQTENDVSVSTGRRVQPERNHNIISGASARGGGLQTPRTNEPLSNDYHRAFSLLRCARTPASTLSCSTGWENCRSFDPTRPSNTEAFHNAIGHIMMELERRHLAGEPPTSLHPHLSVYHKNKRARPRTVEDGTVTLCSLVGDLDAVQFDEEQQHQQTQQPREQFLLSNTPAVSSSESTNLAIVPLLFFAAVVEFPPDIRRYFLLSRTHAYLCDPDGTVAYCAAVRDIHQIVACAGGYMVWRFMPNAIVSTMIMREVRDNKRKSRDVLAGAAARETLRTFTPHSRESIYVARPHSNGNSAFTALSPPNPASASSTASREVRDEMSDWVFRILSVGGLRPASTAETTPTGGIGCAGSASPASGTNNADFTSATNTTTFTTSLRDAWLAEECTSAMVFLLNVMCTLRTLPRLLIDSLVAGSIPAPDNGGVSSSFSAFHRAGGANRQADSSSCSKNVSVAAYTSPWDRPRSTHEQTEDRLDRMHVPGDRPSRVPLLFEGPAGRQTTVKFIEQYWTTRYDQLPSWLRPRRLSHTSYLSNMSTQTLATAASAPQGGIGAQMCYVESPLLLPPIPVLSLNACLAAEDSVMDALQHTSDALQLVTQANANTPRNLPSPGTVTLTGWNNSDYSGAVKGILIPLKNLAEEAEREKAKANLSPAAWRVLERLIVKGSGNSNDTEDRNSDADGDGELNGSRSRDSASSVSQPPKEGAAGGPLWLDDNALTIPLAMHVTPNAANTRALSEDTPSRSSSFSAESRANNLVASFAASSTAASLEDEEKCSGRGSVNGDDQLKHNDNPLTKIEPVREAAHLEKRDVKAAETQPDSKSTANARSSITPESCINVASSTSEKALLTPPLPARLHSVAYSSHGDHVRKMSMHEGDNRPPPPLKPPTSGRTSTTCSNRSGSACSGDAGVRRRCELELKDGSASQVSSKAKLSFSVAKAIAQARLWRQRADETEENGIAEHTDAHSFLSPSVGNQGQKHEESTAIVQAPPTAAVVPSTRTYTCARLPASILSPLSSSVSTVGAFERRIQHRPRRERLLLRGRYIEQLLQLPLRSTGFSICHPKDALMEEKQRYALYDESANDVAPRRLITACTDTKNWLSSEDPKRLLDDLRRQRMIAELMYIQQAETSCSSFAPADTQQFEQASSPPPVGGADARP